MVISIMFIIVGIVALVGLPIAQFPEIVPPEIQIYTTYTGADAETVEQSVATPIEQQLSGVDNMNYMYSLNANNGTMQPRIDGEHHAFARVGAQNLHRALSHVGPEGAFRPPDDPFRVFTQRVP